MNKCDDFKSYIIDQVIYRDTNKIFKKRKFKS